MNAQQIAEKLEKATRKTNGGWMACCPAHADKNPSLSLDDSGDKVLVNCLAGCNQSDVIAALKTKKLWPETEFEIDHPTRGKPDQAWKYHDSAGQVVGYACRYDTPTGKDVLPFFKHSVGWKWKAPEAPRPLYNLHRIKDKPIIVVEGEKAADAASKLLPDYVAVTWQGGSNAADRTDWTPLKGYSVVIWPDADDSGKNAAQVVAGKLQGIAKSVAVIDPPNSDGWDLADALSEGWTTEQVKELIPKTEPEAPLRNFSFTAVADIINQSIKPRWIVRSIMDLPSVTSLFGKAESLKSFAAIDMGLCVASGKAWHGQEIMNTGPVLYVCGEGRAGIGRRVKAWLHHNNVDADVPFFVSTGPAQLLDPKSVEAVEQAALSVEEEHGAPVMIIIDTLNRNFGQGDENSTKDMTQFVAALDRLKFRFDCAVIVIHHSGHQAADRGRGNSSLFGAVDFEYLIARDGDPMTMRCKKAKDYARPAAMTFNPVSVDLGIDDEGQQITSLILELTDEPPRPPRKLSRSQRIALQALEDLSVNGVAVHLDEWRTEAYSKGIADNPSAKQKAFSRAKGLLLNERYVFTHEDKFWLAGHNETNRDPAEVVTMEF